MEKKHSTFDIAGVVDTSFWHLRAVEERVAHTTEPSDPVPRRSVRRALNLQVLVNFGATYSEPSQARDLSLSGAFLAMDARHLVQGAYVEVVLRYRYKETSMEQRIPATVTRLESNGVGVTFGNYDDQTYTDLTNLLYAL
jgi:hypothetical protein